MRKITVGLSTSHCGQFPQPGTISVSCLFDVHRVTMHTPLQYAAAEIYRLHPLQHSSRLIQVIDNHVPAHNVPVFSVKLIIYTTVFLQ